MPEPIEKLDDTLQTGYVDVWNSTYRDYEHCQIPDLSRDNLVKTIAKLNEVIERINALTVVSRLED